MIELDGSGTPLSTRLLTGSGDVVRSPSALSIDLPRHRLGLTVTFSGELRVGDQVITPAAPAGAVVILPLAP